MNVERGDTHTIRACIVGWNTQIRFENLSHI